MSEGGICRTAPATPGLSKLLYHTNLIVEVQFIELTYKEQNILKVSHNANCIELHKSLANFLNLLIIVYPKTHKFLSKLQQTES